MKKTMTDILDDAINNKRIQLAAEIHIGENAIPVVLSNIKWTDITKQQRIQYTSEYSKCAEMGLDKAPIDENEWNEQVNRLRTNAEKAGEKFDESALKKPNNRAEQLASSFAFIETVLSLVPKALIDAEGNPIFNDSHLSKVRQAIDLDNRLFGEIFSMYNKFSKMVDEQEKSTKN